MKRLTFAIGPLLCLAIPVLAEPATTPQVVGGPLELHNPHRVSGLEGAAVQAPSSTPQPVITREPAVAMYAEGRYLFVLRGDSLFQFDKKTLKLLNSIQLPHLTAVAPAPIGNSAEIRTFTAPPVRSSLPLTP